ncbi:MAG: LemA family protein [Paludibacteraceae bacterium]|nr:LemA family protein [Bacteroidales bacterium]MDD6782367.1 LemA family protein [Bacteroidales bacterium]MDD7528013.1 LemA family protein [Bacteroidales bacterium]MDY6036214.1 LemA family protein [Paludibacteraceae bacterium]
MKRNVFYLLLLVVAMSLQSCNYNALVEQEENVDKAWAEVDNQYQRRMDLIPNLVATVQGYVKHEEATLTSVVEARSKASSITLNANELSDEALANFQAAQDELSRGLGRLMAVAESYPDLKANENFMALQDQIEGTENRIAVARRNFNEAAQEYNANIRKFPTVIYAGWFGFEKKPYFKAQAGAETAPRVQF